MSAKVAKVGAKVAKVRVWSIVLVCPHCEQIVHANGKQQIIRRDDVSAQNWDVLQEKSQHGDPYTCPDCHKPFALPASPFK